MKASIVISNPAPTYHSGDSISGFVHLTVSPGDIVRKVCIDFNGTALAAAGGVSPYNERIILALEEETLYAEPNTLNMGDHQWPFNITIPNRCKPHASQALYNQKDVFYNGSPRQSLPPSFEDIAGLHFILSAVNRAGDEIAKITYCLRASFFDKYEDEVKPIITSIPLNFQPQRSSEHPTWDTTTHVCKFKIPLHSKRRPSLTNIFIHRKGDSQDDAVEFLLRARMATTLVVGKPIPIFLLLEHDIIDDTSGPRSTFSIRSITVTLTNETSIRGHSLIRVQHPTGESNSSWETAKQIGSKLTYSVAIQSGGILDVRSLIPDLIVPDSQIPSFLTFNILHLHRLKLKVELMYQDRSFTARYIIKRVLVLPATHKPKLFSEPQQETQETTTNQPPSTNPQTTVPAFNLRRAIDEEFESAAPMQSASDEPPSFETATSTTNPTPLQPTTARPEDPPSFEAAIAPVERRGSALRRLSFDEPPPFESAVGEEELPGYAREETY